MNHIGLKLGPLGYRVIDLPPLPQDARDNFANLPEDPYYTERWRQFSQYVLFFEHDHWACRVLEHRPFIQAKAYKQKVGGVRRNFEPISGVDPTPQFAAIASELDFDNNAVFQVNLHQWRTRVNETYQGKTIHLGAAPGRTSHHQRDRLGAPQHHRGSRRSTRSARPIRSSSKPSSRVNVSSCVTKTWFMAHATSTPCPGKAATAISGSSRSIRGPTGATARSSRPSRPLSPQVSLQNDAVPPRSRCRRRGHTR